VKRLLIVLAMLAPFPAAAGNAPSVLVRTAPLRQHAIAETLVGYGTLATDVGGTIDVSLPRAGRISALEVSPGQVVKKGAGLLEFRTAPGAALGYRRARNALAFARSELARTRQLRAQRLATASQVAAARKSLADAEAALEAQLRLGAGTASESVKAPFDGVVLSIGGAPGDRLAAGAAVLKLARLSGLRVLLGIEPSDSFAVRPGMPVRLTPVFDARRTVEAHVAAVHGMVDPRTQLVDVVVKIAAGDLLPGMRVKGEITLASRTGWAVPRSAVLHDGRGDYLFQVAHGVARRVAVRVESDGDRLLGISGAGLDPALKVVVVGNYELADGMAVRETAQ